MHAQGTDVSLFNPVAHAVQVVALEHAEHLEGQI
jgi:hypothetical protein